MSLLDRISYHPKPASDVLPEFQQFITSAIDELKHADEALAAQGATQEIQALSEPLVVRLQEAGQTPLPDDLRSDLMKAVERVEDILLLF